MKMNQNSVAWGGKVLSNRPETAKHVTSTFSAHCEEMPKGEGEEAYVV